MSILFAESHCNCPARAGPEEETSRCAAEESQCARSSSTKSRRPGSLTCTGRPSVTAWPGPPDSLARRTAGTSCQVTWQQFSHAAKATPLTSAREDHQPSAPEGLRGPGNGAQTYAPEPSVLCLSPGETGPRPPAHSRRSVGALEGEEFRPRSPRVPVAYGLQEHRYHGVASPRGAGSRLPENWLSDL
jgi:hypothetical protein